jgi:hypothetical protein
MRAPLLFVLPAVAATALVLSCGETEEDLPDGAELSLTPEVTTAATPAASPEPAPTPAAEPTPMPGPIPSDWKEYRDEGLGFSLRYPPDWTLIMGAAADEHRLSLGGIEFERDDGVRVAAVFVFANPDGLSLQNWILEYNPIFLDEDRRVEETTISGEPALFAPISAVGTPSPARTYRRVREYSP